MKLYQEILLLKHYFKGKYCVENVISYYKPLIAPLEMGGHYLWTNFHVPKFSNDMNRDHSSTIDILGKRKGFDLQGKRINKRLVLRNCTEPEIGAHILRYAFEINSLFSGSNRA